MFEKRPVCNDVYTIKNTQLMKLRNKSIRFGVWFRKLQMLYRVLIDLTITVTESARSVALTAHLVVVIRKIENVIERQVTRVVTSVDLPLVQRISKADQNLGNISVQNWAFNIALSVYLAIMHLNNSNKFKT